MAETTTQTPAPCDPLPRRAALSAPLAALLPVKLAAADRLADTDAKQAPPAKG